ncbi:MAG: VOC family protein [Cognaticolwellia sp.]
MHIRSLLLSALLFSLPSIAPIAMADSELPGKTMTAGLNHIGLTVKDLTASSNFFTKTLGWKQVGGYPDYPAIFVTDGNVFVTLWQTKSANKVVEFDRSNNVGLHHLALTVTSAEMLEELHQRLKKAPGVIIEFSPELNGKGPTVHMMIREPSGNRLEFAYSPPKKITS